MASANSVNNSDTRGVYDRPLDLNQFSPIHTVYDMEDHPFDSQTYEIEEMLSVRRHEFVSKVRGFTARRASCTPPQAPPSTPTTAIPLLPVAKADVMVLQPECCSSSSGSSSFFDWDIVERVTIAPTTPSDSLEWKDIDVPAEGRGVGSSAASPAPTKIWQKAVIAIKAEAKALSRTIGSLQEQCLFPAQAFPDDEVAEALEYAISELSQALSKFRFLVCYYSPETWERPTVEMKASMQASMHYYDTVKMVLRGHALLGKYVHGTMTTALLSHVVHF